MNTYSFSDSAATFIAMVVCYGWGHWIAGTFLLVFLFAIEARDDQS